MIPPVSACCHAPVRVVGIVTKHYECSKCGKPGDPATDRYWCAWCGKWGDHQSGWCPDMQSVRDYIEEQEDT